MRLIKQTFSTSCGIACVAMLLNLNQKYVMKIAAKLFDWDISKSSGNFRTNKEDIIDLLRKLGYKGEAKFEKFKDWQSFEGLNLVAVRYTKNHNWHWVVVVGKNNGIMIYNPEKTSKIFIPKGSKPDGRTYGRAKFYLNVKT
ncbi:Peptidase C39 family protein [Fibrobacter sp. UWH5]|uniref:cysteine peptidase family C39 domain-containing protein n=1 Tax=Fibrobacter sp. UWH5 TaxID=1896211 RepID=UPI000921FFA9|nr:cysteine peptidase family C39 domain-containing protein [Fibrobacter sp. UWH5]SHL46097.1 Peptidase C39 family protein [Fibrobacter sp. UWH5]